MYKYISIEGIIGAGKTMLAEYLSGKLSVTPTLEQFEENIHLPDFYIDPDRHALEVESFFLEQRYRQLSEIDISKTIIADYHFGKCLVFGKITLPSSSRNSFEELFWKKQELLPASDLILYLKVNPENAKQNILKRGRGYETNISFDYLSKLQTGYLDFFSELLLQRIVVIDINSIDFGDPGIYYSKIMETIYQKHPVGVSHIIL